MDKVARIGKYMLCSALFGAMFVFVSLFNINISNVQAQEVADGDNPNIKLLSSSHYKDSIGYLHVVGEVQNTSPDARKYVQVTATFYDPTNRVVGTSFSFTEIDVLRPGEKSPFDIILDNEAQSGKVHDYKLNISSNNAESKPVHLKLSVGENYYDDLGSAHILGEVTNQGTENTKYVKVSGTIYNEKNQVVATDFTFTEPSDLLPGQSAPFDIVISEKASTASFGRMSSGSLNVQSSDYAMILPAVTFLMDGKRDDGYSIVSSGTGSSNSDNDNDEDLDGNGNGNEGNCDPSYPDVCIPSKPPDLDCPDISSRNFKVVGSDPHGFDGNNDGIGCNENGGGISDNDDNSGGEDDELPSCQDDNRPRPGSCRDDLDTNEDPQEDEEEESEEPEETPNDDDEESNDDDEESNDDDEESNDDDEESNDDESIGLST